MAAPTNYYVDPLNGNDSTGNGTSGTPWKSVQKALNTITRNASNGDQINVKAGAADVLAAALSFTSYGTPSQSAPLVVRGYTTTAGDGGIGEIDANNGIIVNGSNISYTLWADLKLHNASGYLFDTYSGAYVVGAVFFNCEFYDATYAWIGRSSNGDLVGAFIGCYFHDMTSANNMQNSPVVYDSCFIKGMSGSYCLDDYNCRMFVKNCIIVAGASQGGIYLDLNGQHVLVNNTIYSAGSTGSGIEFRYVAMNASAIMNNVIVGFAKGVYLSHTDHQLLVYAKNRFYNCTTNLSNAGTIALDYDNSTLAANPFTDAANGDFSVSTALKAAGYPSSFLGSNTNQYLDIGAAQRQEQGAGGLAINPIGGHIIRGLV